MVNLFLRIKKGAASSWPAPEPTHIFKQGSSFIGLALAALKGGPVLYFSSSRNRSSAHPAI